MAMPTVQGELAPARAAGAWGVCEISRTTWTIPHFTLSARVSIGANDAITTKARVDARTNVTGRHSGFTVLSRERMVRVPYSQNSPFLANAEAGLPVLHRWRFGNGADGNLSA
jgi:hypothetical protein